MQILYDNSLSPNNSNLKYESRRLYLPKNSQYLSNHKANNFHIWDLSYWTVTAKRIVI